MDKEEEEKEISKLTSWNHRKARKIERYIFLKKKKKEIINEDKNVTWSRRLM